MLVRSDTLYNFQPQNVLKAKRDITFLKRHRGVQRREDF